MHGCHRQRSGGPCRVVTTRAGLLDNSLGRATVDGSVLGTPWTQERRKWQFAFGVVYVQMSLCVVVVDTCVILFVPPLQTFILFYFIFYLSYFVNVHKNGWGSKRNSFFPNSWLWCYYAERLLVLRKWMLLSHESLQLKEDLNVIRTKNGHSHIPVSKAWGKARILVLKKISLRKI